MVSASRVLIVDDEPEFCRIIQRFLRGEPYVLQAAHCGQDAIEALGQGPPFDVVLLDLNLPDMIGFTVMGHIATHFPDTLVIIMTGYASLESATEALRHGAHDYLTKPFAREELFKALQNALAHKQVKDAHRQAQADLLDSEICFRNLVENLLSGVLIVREGELLYQNAIQKESFGVVTEAVLARDFSKAHPEDAGRLRSLMARFLAQEVESAETDFRFYVPGEDGNTMKWAITRASRISYRGKPSVLLNTVDVSRFIPLG